MVRWRRDTRSANVEDRRGAGMPSGIPTRIPIGRAGAGGIGAVLLLLILIGAAIMGIGPLDTGGTPAAGGGSAPPDEQRLADFSSRVLGETEIVWSQVFSEELGRTYTPPKLVLYSGYVQSACGQASAAVGPFYCPSDQRIYVDLDFFHDLSAEYGAPGDFAQAYVIAHEVGHHVQTLLGTTQYVEAAQRRATSQAEANRLSVQLELQADCYAGLWAKRASAQDLILEPGDVEEGLNAASAIGDDRLQQQSQGYIVPDSFTHGTSAQRVQCFQNGFGSGTLGGCNCGGDLPRIAST